MAIAHVQTANARATSGTATLTVTTTAGNAVIVHLIRDGDVSAPTQTAGDTLTQRVDVSGSGERTTQYTNYNIAGGSTAYTFTFTSTNWRIVVSEFSGLNTAQTTPDASGTLAFVTGSASNHVVCSGATTNANDVVMACWNGDGSGGTTLTSTNGDDAVGWTRPANGVDLTTGTEFVVAYEIVSATATYGCTLVTVDPMSVNAVVGAYKAAAGASASVRPSAQGLLGVS